MKAPCTTNPDIFETAFFSQMRVDGETTLDSCFKNIGFVWT